MLEGLRKASSGWVAKLLMGLLVLSFAIWGISDIFRGFGATTLATVGDTKITAETFERILRSEIEKASQRAGRTITLEEARRSGLPTRVLGRLVSDATYQSVADEMGLGITDRKVRETIVSDPAFKGSDGRFDRDRFRLLLRNIGYSEDDFVEERRDLAIRLQVVSGLVGGVRAPLTALEMAYDFEKEKRVIDAIVLTREVIGEIPPPGEQVLAAYFEKNKTNYRAPEFRKITYFTISPEKLANPESVTDAEARKSYESDLARYTTAEQRNLKQVLFDSREEAEKFAARLKAGESFKDLVAERGLTDEDVDLGLMTREMLVDPAIADVAFSLKEGETSDVVDGRFGSVIVKVTKIVPESVTPFEDVKQTIKRGMALSRAESEVLDLHDAIEDARAGGQTLAEIARRFDLQTHTVEAVSRNGTDPDGNLVTDLPESPEFLGSAFESDVGLENDPLQDDQGGFTWYEIEAVTPARDRTLEELHDEIVAAWTRDEIRSRLRAKAGEIVARLKRGEDISRIAGELDVALETTAPFSRQDASGGLVELATEAAFAGGKGHIGFAPAPNSDVDQLVFVVREVEIPPFFAEEADVAEFRKKLDSLYAQDLLIPFVEKLQSELGVRVNQKLLFQLVGQSGS